MSGMTSAKAYDSDKNQAPAEPALASSPSCHRENKSPQLLQNARSASSKSSGSDHTSALVSQNIFRGQSAKPLPSWEMDSFETYLQLGRQTSTFVRRTATAGRSEMSTELSGGSFSDRN